MCTVMCILNGQQRPIVVRDRSIASDMPTAEKADRTNPDHIAAPFDGVVTAGQTVATIIEAMKIEPAITAPKAGKVDRVAMAITAQVEGGDLLVAFS
jgi:pyruvate carboxylase